MFYRTICVCLVGLVLVKLVKMDPEKDITFKIQSIQSDGKPTLTCDHSDDKKQQYKYTVLEGEPFTIVTKYEKIINHFICHEYNNEKTLFISIENNLKNVTTFKAEKGMGTLWNCTIYAHIGNPYIKRIVRYKNDNYTAASCFMKIHVRQKESPQTVLVSNMVLPALRTNLSDKVIDFTAEYHYADGDVVNVTCINFLKETELTMAFDMAGIVSDKSTMKNISSSKMIGFVTKLHSGHNSSFMTCTNTETTDYTIVMVRFIMRTKFNIVSITINGMILRPKLNVAENNNYAIEYKYVENQPINVTCKVEVTDMKLVVLDDEFEKGKVSGYKLDNISERAVMKFSLQSKYDGKTLGCAVDKIGAGSVEMVYIKFTAGNFPIEQFPLHMELQSKGTAMELYNDESKHNIIFYEFIDGETLNVTCGPLRRNPGPLHYLNFEGSSCKTDRCNITKTLRVTPKRVNNSIACYLMDEHDINLFNIHDAEVREIRVIIIERILTTTTSSTTTTTTTNAPRSVVTQAEISSGRTISGTSTSSELPPKVNGESEINFTTLAVIGCSVACIIIICVSILIIKLRKRNHSQGGPQNRNYENLAEPSEASIPAYPPQWENNYAVPVDRRTDDTTYSVPCSPADLYATPTPKNLRNKKQKPVDPTYAVLEVQNGQAQKNAFKETEDPNYSEVYANRQEQCYAKVLPKSVRNKMEQDNPYSYVTNEPSYANTTDPEPMYCEPAKAQGREYANLNNSRYVNSNAQEYAEPAYCELQKRKK